MATNKSIKTNFMYTLFYRVLAMFIPLITTPYVARVLGAEGVGLYSYTYSITAYFVLFGNFGSATYAQLAIAKTQDDKHNLSKIFYEVLIARTITMLAVILVYIFFVAQYNQYMVMFIILSSVIIAELLNLSWFYQGLEEFKSITIRNVIVKLVSVLLIFIYVNDAKDLYLYALIVNGSSVIGNILLFLGLKKYLVKISLMELQVKKHFRGFIIYFIPAIASTINSNLDKTMLGVIANSKYENGYYEQAYKIEVMILTIFSSLNMVLRPRMAALWNNKSYDKIRNTSEKSLLLVLCLAIAIFFGLNGISREFVPLFLGQGYEKVILLLNIFSFTIVLKAVSNYILEQFLVTSGKMRIVTKLIFLGAIVNITLNLILIRPFSSVGAALATVGSEAAILLGTYYFNRHYLKEFKIKSSLVKFVLSGILMLLIVRLLLTKSIVNFYYLFFVIIVGILIYFTLLVVLKEKLAASIIINFYHKLVKK